MRSRVFGKKLGRNRRGRSRLFRALAKSMIKHGRIKTTKPKAVAVRRDLDKLIGLVKKNDLAARRRALSILANDKESTKELFEKYTKLAGSRNSGFTKTTLLSNRRGDNTPMVSLSWVELEEKKDENVSSKT